MTPQAMTSGPVDQDEVWNTIAYLTRWLDEANAGHLSPKEIRQLRIMKLTEEVGEVVTAHIGTTNQNPRKGTYATDDDVLSELGDVVITAMVAAVTLAGSVDAARRALDSRLSAVFERAVRHLDKQP